MTNTTRRDAMRRGVAAGAALTLGGSFITGWGGQLPSATGLSSGNGGMPDWSDPKVNLRNIVRMQGSLREEDVPWWFTGVIFGVRGRSRP